MGGGLSPAHFHSTFRKETMTTKKVSHTKLQAAKEAHEVEVSPDTPRTPDAAPKGEAKDRAETVIEDKADVETFHKEGEPTVEVGVLEGVTDVDHEAYNRLLQEAAEAKQTRAPKVTQPEYALSYQEQQDPAFHERLAKESLEAQKAAQALLDEQNANYLAGK